MMTTMMLAAVAWDPPPVQYYQALATLLPLLLFTAIYQSKVANIEGLEKAIEAVADVRRLLRENDISDEALLAQNADHERRIGRIQRQNAVLAILILSIGACGIFLALLGVAEMDRLATFGATICVGPLLALIAVVEITRASDTRAHRILASFFGGAVMVGNILVAVAVSS